MTALTTAENSFETTTTSRATVTSIKASSRVSVCIDKNYYTVEYTEERSLPDDMTEAELNNERVILWDDVNNEVDLQVLEIQKTFKR